MSSQGLVAVIGGSGLYRMEGLEVLSEEKISTPFGEPSDVIIRGTIAGREILFLPRHGRGHGLLPHEVNARANIYALKKLGAVWCIGVSAAGSLVEQLAPGDLLVPDQIIDRTWGRPSTFFGEGVVAHVSMAEPYCPVLREVLAQAADQLNIDCKVNGTFVCMQGPAFSSKAESFMHREMGGRAIGMTCVPEAKLAREAEISYANLVIITDYDCWHEHEEVVDARSVIEFLGKGTAKAQKIITKTLSLLESRAPSDLASKALQNALFCDLKTLPADSIKKLEPILARYLKAHSDAAPI